MASGFVVNIRTTASNKDMKIFESFEVLTIFIQQYVYVYVYVYVYLLSQHILSVCLPNLPGGGNESDGVTGDDDDHDVDAHS